MLSLLLSLYISAPPPQHFPVPPTIQPAQVIQLSSSRPYTQASSALVADLNTNSILYQNNSNKRLPIASLTKLMTVLILLEENQLDEIVTIPAEATQLGGTTMYLHSNEQITVLDLIKGSLIQSGNDAAYSLAVHNAGTANEFVKKMNKKSQQLNLHNTSFANPMGFDDPKNYSTAQDLLILAKEVFSHQIVQEIVKQEEEKVYSTDQSLTHSLVTTNKILNNYLQVIGLKTGTTDLAGQCLIAITNTNHPTVAIVLNSNNRFLDVKTMLDWAQTNFAYSY